MPSKQTNDVIDNIEELVNEIKLNLRLKAAPTSSVPLNTASDESSTTTTSNTSITLTSPTDAPNVYSNKCQPPLQTNHDQYQQNQLNHNHPQQQQNIIRKQRSRPSPYHIPSRSWSEPTNAIFGPSKRLLGNKKNDENNLEDPYEMLQTLIKSNSLVKEAVRRLQLTSSSYSRKQRYFYDSDEETTRSPALVMMCQLES